MKFNELKSLIIAEEQFRNKILSVTKSIPKVIFTTVQNVCIIFHFHNWR